jgi:metallo-beta-lactamase class B
MFRRSLLNATALAAVVLAFLSLSPAQDRATAPNVPANAQPSDDEMRNSWEAWNAPFNPLRIIGNVYYVGVTGVSSFLITTPDGHFLVDTGFEKTVPRIKESLTKLGFRLEDIKIVLSSHAHLDHVGGHALMKKLTGAKIMMSEADAALLASGGTTDFTPYATNVIAYAPATVDRLLHDGDTVSLGGTTLTCHLTPGHTKGCTTWTMDVTQENKVYHVLFFGSTTVLDGVSLVNNAKYPNIVEDYLSTYQKLKNLPCDVFLAPHAGFFGLANKAARLEKGEKPNPFIDPSAYRNFIGHAESDFRERLQREQKQPGG